ncbi:hypothetical protein HKX48_005167 [Thoreauomyces humboldtii]|nr:hypothetical protein HKX48_005167 [Thoreauomyces humboldtii]
MLPFPAWLELVGAPEGAASDALWVIAYTSERTEEEKRKTNDLKEQEKRKTMRLAATLKPPSGTHNLSHSA